MTGTTGMTHGGHTLLGSMGRRRGRWGPRLGVRHCLAAREDDGDDGDHARGSDTAWQHGETMGTTRGSHTLFLTLKTVQKPVGTMGRQRGRQGPRAGVLHCFSP